MKKFLKQIFLMLVYVILGGTAGYLLSSYVQFSSIIWNVKLLTSTGTLAGLGAGVFVFLLTKLNNLDKDKSKSSKTGAFNKEGKKTDQHYSSRLTTKKELETQSKFMYSTFDNLHLMQKDGIPIRAENIKGKTHCNMYKPIHTIVIGTTGAGKTTKFVIPALQMLSECATKPSLVISDPKGELYNMNSEMLKEKGYEVHVVDLRDPQKSSRWNPIERAFDAYQRAHNITKEVKIHRNDKPEQYKKLQLIPNGEYGETWWEFNGVAYHDKKILNNDLLAKQDELKNVAMEDVTEIAATLCPIAGNDPSWSQGAQGFIKGVMIAMLEDSVDPDVMLRKDQFNFYNVREICGKIDQGQDQYATLKQYFQGRSKLSEAPLLGNAVVQNAPTTAKGFMGIVSSSLNLFSDSGICYLTSGSDIDFNTFADKPTALFLKIPDEKDNRHALANMYISQLYKMLIERANQTKKLELPRQVYFLLDEFGNLPKIEKLKSFITAGRSRKITLVLVIQDYKQLNAIYGPDDAATIKNNCNIHIFLGTKDSDTREQFSKNCGQEEIEVINESTSNGGNGDKKQESKSYSKQKVTKPIIDPNELDHLAESEVIINLYPEFTIRSSFTPSYKNKSYKMEFAKEGYKQSHFFDKAKAFYDIEERNATKLRKQEEDEDDGLL